MPQELLPGTNIASSNSSSLPDESEQDPHRDQPLGGVPLLADGSNTPPYPKVIDDLLIEREVQSASRELLTYISSMRKQAEAKSLSERRSINVAKSAFERRS